MLDLIFLLRMMERYILKTDWEAVLPSGISQWGYRGNGYYSTKRKSNILG